MADRAGTVVAVVAGAVATLSVLPAGGPAALAASGVVLLFGGSYLRRRRASTLGGLLVLGAVCWAAIAGLGPWLVLLGTIGAVVAWDGAATARGLEAQLGTDAETTRAVLVHAGATTAVVSLLAVLAYAVALVGRGQRPLLGVALLAGGAVVLVWGLAADRA